MRTAMRVAVAVAVGSVVGLGVPGRAPGNGGPFVVKYPSGDPAAKGVLARLDPSLKPARETRLRVVKEDLTIDFDREIILGRVDPSSGQQGPPPLAFVSAEYTIENPTEEEVQVDFGFPILRGIYVNPLSMMPTPEAAVTVDGKKSAPAIISNSVIYGLIRQRARATIEEAIAADKELAELVGGVRQARAAGDSPKPDVDDAELRGALRSYLVGKLKWDERDSALLVEYAGLDLGQMKGMPYDRWNHGFSVLLGQGEKGMVELSSSNLGPLAAIGEQKATQLFAQLAGRFDREAAATYEAVFAAWGGDVRERSVDLGTGEVRPRQYSVNPEVPAGSVVTALGGMPDPTIYARVDYLDPNALINEAEKASCRTVLKNLPVVFTFAPMNLLHYQVTFPAGSKRVVAVRYRQYAYSDTREPASYQLAYVLHPASLWNDFGPIHLKVRVPTGVGCRASVPMEKVPVTPVRQAADVPAFGPGGMPSPSEVEVYGATLMKKADKKGELFIGLSRSEWDAWAGPKATETAVVRPAAKTPAKQ